MMMMMMSTTEMLLVLTQHTHTHAHTHTHTQQQQQQHSIGDDRNAKIGTKLSEEEIQGVSTYHRRERHDEFRSRVTAWLHLEHTNVITSLQHITDLYLTIFSFSVRLLAIFDIADEEPHVWNVLYFSTVDTALTQSSTILAYCNKQQHTVITSLCRMCWLPGGQSTLLHWHTHSQPKVYLIRLNNGNTLAHDVQVQLNGMPETCWWNARNLACTHFQNLVHTWL